MKHTQYYDRERPEVLEMVPLSASRLLDVGCGAGWLGAQIKKRQQAVVWGIEIIEAAAKIASERLDHVWNFPAEQALEHIPPGSLDCIVLADVLEHLVDPWGLLVRLREKLVEGGVVVASIPNVQHWSVLKDLLEGGWAYAEEGLLDRTHLRFFTRKTAAALFENAGLRVAAIGASSRGVDKPTPGLLKALRSANLDVSSLAADAQVFQFLIRAERPRTPVRDPQVGVVVVDRNDCRDTIECLESLQQLDYANYQITVVDNGGPDERVRALESNFPGVSLVRTHKSLGHAGGNNVGVRHALRGGADYILLLGNETVVHSGMLRKLIEASYARPKAGLYGPAIYSYFSREQLLSIGGVRRFSNPFDFVQVSAEGRVYQEVETLAGCAMLVKREVFERIGCFDESFFLCWDEIDFCTRATKSGFQCLAVPEALVWHKVEAASGESGSEGAALRTYFDVRNQLLWAKRHLPTVEYRALVRRQLLTAKRIFLPKFHVASGTGAYYKRLLWSVREYLSMVSSNVQSPGQRAKLFALRDYFLGRFGDCPAAVRRLSAP